jgi:hypothetical protein
VKVIPESSDASEYNFSKDLNEKEASAFWKNT